MNSETTSALADSPFRQELQHLREHWLMLLCLGGGLVLIGTLAIIFSFIATLATVTMFGSLLFVGGVIQVVSAVTCRSWRGFFVHLVSAIFFGIVGMIMLNHPLAAAGAVTLMLAAVFMAGGVIRIVVAAVDRFYGWPWVMLNGFINLFLGLFIWRHFPEAAFWVVGVFVGVDLLFSGWSWIMLALGARSAFPKSAV